MVETGGICMQLVEVRRMPPAQALALTRHIKPQLAQWIPAHIEHSGRNRARGMPPAPWEEMGWKGCEVASAREPST